MAFHVEHTAFKFHVEHYGEQRGQNWSKSKTQTSVELPGIQIRNADLAGASLLAVIQTTRVVGRKRRRSDAINDPDGVTACNVIHSTGSIVSMSSILALCTMIPLPSIFAAT